MFQSGKVHQIAKEMKRLGIPILGVRKKENQQGAIIQRSSTLLWSDTKLSPLESCGGGPMFWSKQRGLSQSEW